MQAHEEKRRAELQRLAARFVDNHRSVAAMLSVNGFIRKKPMLQAYKAQGFPLSIKFVLSNINVAYGTMSEKTLVLRSRSRQTE